MTAIGNVLLDVDGTLVDSNDAHARAWMAALTEAGFGVPYRRVRSLVGMGGDKLLPQVTGITHDEEKGRRILNRRREIFLQREMGSVRVLPGARALVLRLLQEGLSLAIASSAHKDELGPLLVRAEVDDLIPLRTSSSDAERSKPDPDIIEAALEDLGCEPAEAMLIGDTPYDIDAGARAEVRVIAFRSGGWPDVQLNGAWAIYDGPAHLLSQLDESALGQRRRRLASEAAPGPAA